MPSDLRAATLMRNNVRALLDARREDQAALAHWVRHSRSWINKFLNGERQVQLKDLDRIADFFGIATYQLFQPGISALTERRVQERRKRKDRRIGHALRRLADTRDGLLLAKLPKTRRAHKALPAAEIFDKESPTMNPSREVGHGAPVPDVAAIAEELARLQAIISSVSLELGLAATSPLPDRSVSSARPRPPKGREVAE